jgi:hypothetical protein
VTPGGGGRSVFLPSDLGERQRHGRILIHSERSVRKTPILGPGCTSPNAAPLSGFYGHDRIGGHGSWRTGRHGALVPPHGPCQGTSGLYEKTWTRGPSHRLPLEASPGSGSPHGRVRCRPVPVGADYFRENLMERAFGLHLDPGEDRLLEASLHGPCRPSSGPPDPRPPGCPKMNILVRTGNVPDRFPGEAPGKTPSRPSSSCAPQ